VFRPVICRAQPQSEPGTGWGTPIVSTTGFPLGALNTRRAAIRRILGGAAKDWLIHVSEILSGGATSSSAGGEARRVIGEAQICKRQEGLCVVAGFGNP
jgi:hypothetical protein